MKYTFSLFSLLLLVTIYNTCYSQIKIIQIPGTDSSFVINIGEIEENAKRVAKEAREIAAQVQVEEMEEYIQALIEVQQVEFDSLSIKFEKMNLDEQIRLAEEQVRLHQEEIEKAAEEACRPYKMMEYTNFVSSFKLDYNGKISISEEEDNITSISPGGKFSISKSTFGNKRKVVIKPGENGNLKYQFFVGNKEVPFDPDGQNWLADILPEVVRGSTIAAESRIERQMKKGGLTKTLSYISKVSGSNNKATFYRLLISRNDIDGEDLNKITREVNQNISSSSNLSEYFSETYAIYNNKKGHNAYFNGIGKISSSYDKSDCLRKIISTQEYRDNFNEEHWEMWLKVVQTISSSYEASNILKDAFSYDVSKMPARALEESLSKISSSYEKANAIEAAFKSPNNKLWNEKQYNALLHATQTITSSYEKKNTLEEALQNWEYWKDNTRIIFFNVASSISSSAEKASLLQELEDYKMNTGETIHAFYEACKSINSSYELSNVLQDIAQSDYFTKLHYKEYITTCTYISSSSEMSDALEKIGKCIAKSKDEQLIELYKTAANKISSNYDRENAMEALNK